MEWLIGIGLVIYAYYKIIVKAGNLNAWKLIKAYKDSAFQLFISNPARHVCKTNSDKTIDMKNWDSPFWIWTPDGRNVKVYGKIGEYEKTLDEFIKTYGKK